MNVSVAPALRVFVVCLLAASLATVAAARTSTGPNQDKSKAPPQISADEQKAIAKIRAAADLPAKLLAAEEYVKKFPKSTQRLEVARAIAAEISKVTDAAMMTSLSEKYLATFTEAKEAGVIQVLLIDTHARGGRVAEAFKIGTPYLEKNPEDAPTMTQLALVGIDQAKRGNATFVPQSVTYAKKAIELIEADKKPEEVDAATWQVYKKDWLPQLYLSLGIVSYMTGNKEDAKARFEKTVAIGAMDPMGYIMLGTLANEEYQQMAERYKTLMAGPAKDETLKRANTKLDEIIDLYAHAVGLMAGDARYQNLHDQILQDLTAYYKYRKNSTDGLQELINKYKKP